MKPILKVQMRLGTKHAQGEGQMSRMCDASLMGGWADDESLMGGWAGDPSLMGGWAGDASLMGGWADDASLTD